MSHKCMKYCAYRRDVYHNGNRKTTLKKFFTLYWEFVSKKATTVLLDEKVMTPLNTMKMQRFTPPRRHSQIDRIRIWYFDLSTVLFRLSKRSHILFTWVMNSGIAAKTAFRYLLAFPGYFLFDLENFAGVF